MKQETVENVQTVIAKVINVRRLVLVGARMVTDAWFMESSSYKRRIEVADDGKPLKRNR